MPVLVIRHADAGSRQPGADDRARGLSPVGITQARLLVPVLQEHAPKRLLSSPYARCVQTLEPAAAALGLPIETHDELAEGSAERALGLLRRIAGENVALCTHGDVIPELLTAIADEDGVDLGPEPRQAKGSVWVLDHSGERFVRALYLRPKG